MALGSFFSVPDVCLSTKLVSDVDQDTNKNCLESRSCFIVNEMYDFCPLHIHL